MNYATHPAVLKIERVGSRVTCNPPPKHTDTDFLVLADEERCGDYVCFLWDSGFSLGGSRITDETSGLAPHERFQSFTNKLRENLIVTMSGTFYDRFIVATKVCKQLNLMHKPQRIMVFQAILYGKWRQP